MRSVVGLSSAALLWCTVLGQEAGAGQVPDYRLFHDLGKDDAAAPAEGAKVNRLAPIAGDWSFTGGSELKLRLGPEARQGRPDVPGDRPAQRLEADQSADPLVL